MLPCLITPPALCIYAPVLLQDAEPDLKPISLTAAQKTLFDSLSKMGYKRIRVRASEKEEERYVTLQKTGRDDMVFIHVSPKRTSISVDRDADDMTAEVQQRFEKLVKSRFPLVQVEFSILDDVTLSLETPTKELTTTWALEALGTLNKAVALQKEAVNPVAVTEASDPVGKTLKAAGYTFTQVGVFHKVRITFTDNKRTQSVFIRQAVWDYNSVKVQEVYSTFYESTEAPSAALLQQVAQKVFNIGGVVLEQPSEKQTYWRMRFRIDAPVDVTTARLRKYVILAAGTADALERELNPGKEDAL